MLIAVISDIHDNLANLAKVLKCCQQNKITKLICCGDTTTLETINYLAINFPGEIFVVRGNIEIYEDDELAGLKNIKSFGAVGKIKIAETNIAFCHEPIKIEKILNSSHSKPDFIFYGHTHKPWLEKRDNVTIVNPGNVAGVWHQATFAILNVSNKKLELKIIADLV